MATRRAYLGDGAYADMEGYTVRIWCERDGGEHFVYLEPVHLNALLHFVRSCGWSSDDPKTTATDLAAENDRLRRVIAEYERDRISRLGGIGSPA